MKDSRTEPFSPANSSIAAAKSFPSTASSSHTEFTKCASTPPAASAEGKDRKIW